MEDWYRQEGYRDEPVGVYGYRCVKTNKWYVGQTRARGSFQARNRDEMRELENKASCLRKFARAWEKHKKEGFTSQLILEWRDRSSFSSKQEMIDWCNEQEEKWIRVKNSFHNGYNCTTGGKSYAVSDNAKDKMRGDKNPSKRRGVREKMKKSWTQKRKIAMSFKMRGNKNSPIGTPKVKSISEEKAEKLRQHFSGDKSSLAVLSWNQVSEIRNLYNTGKYSQSQIGVLFNQHRSNISRIVRNAIWKTCENE